MLVEELMTKVFASAKHIVRAVVVNTAWIVLTHRWSTGLGSPLLLKLNEVLVRLYLCLTQLDHSLANASSHLVQRWLLQAESQMSHFRQFQPGLVCYSTVAAEESLNLVDSAVQVQNTTFECSTNTM